MSATVANSADDDSLFAMVMRSLPSSASASASNAPAAAAAAAASHFETTATPVATTVTDAPVLHVAAEQPKTVVPTLAAISVRRNTLSSASKPNQANLVTGPASPPTSKRVSVVYAQVMPPLHQQAAIAMFPTPAASPPISPPVSPRGSSTHYATVGPASGLHPSSLSNLVQIKQMFNSTGSLTASDAINTSTHSLHSIGDAATPSTTVAASDAAPQQGGPTFSSAYVPRGPTVRQQQYQSLPTSGACSSSSSSSNNNSNSASDAPASPAAAGVPSRSSDPACSTTAFAESMELQIRKIEERIAIERRIVEGARRLLQQPTSDLHITRQRHAYLEHSTAALAELCDHLERLRGGSRARILKISRMSLPAIFVSGRDFASTGSESSHTSLNANGEPEMELNIGLVGTPAFISGMCHPNLSEGGNSSHGGGASEDASAQPQPQGSPMAKSRVSQLAAFGRSFSLMSMGGKSGSTSNLAGTPSKPPAAATLQKLPESLDESDTCRDTKPQRHNSDSSPTRRAAATAAEAQLAAQQLRKSKTPSPIRSRRKLFSWYGEQQVAGADCDSLGDASGSSTPSDSSNALSVPRVATPRRQSLDEMLPLIQPVMAAGTPNLADATDFSSILTRLSYDDWAAIRDTEV
ncbi:hypothetical protein CAOG_05641 [Capsaspora owczarzaki ATCC 30864]|uniref:Uncharacterized protein n=1 Tax=Capsaspora owczarzaki (strain ATCC 30864) TaxID=595528 RepID=A0A0D2UJ99_CAPO3|nr:hypothetical protein CAOG_05641 [Capsaspora owczarzaki ATCC 30864]KJE95161.1 hypothetical protein CAOG_005641 [Capsaspora owczarzaki ATCC 30864]|eukprot:XP_004346314.1 hypothetical protein CAOG_05641 [Capsaspora owczarzaki ATCC 30864]